MLKVHVSDLKWYLPPYGVAAVVSVRVAQRENKPKVNAMVVLEESNNLLFNSFRRSMDP